MNETPILPDDDPISMPSKPTQWGGDPACLGRIDHYDLLRKLGGGGFGVVYLAWDSVSGVEVALKTLHPLLKHNAEEMDQLREKFALVSRLAHPNIATALVLHPCRDVNVWDETARAELKLSPGDSVMVMRYAPGVTLSKWRRQFPGGVVPFDLALEAGRQVASALDYAHGERIVHRDIKPSNVMVETVAAEPRPLDHGQNAARSLSAPTLRVRILDFGLAAEIRSTMARVSAESGDTSGTRPYMAPEQWLGRKQDGRTDQYALACVLYELLSGAPPFAGVFETGDPAIMRTAVVSDQPEEIGDLSPAANAALLRALSKDPSARFPSCTAFVAALSQGRGVSTKRPLRRAGWIAAALLAAVAGVFLTQSRRSPQSPVAPPPVVESRAEPAESAEGRARSNPFSPDPSSGGASRPGEPQTPGAAVRPETSLHLALPPEGASRAELEDAVARLTARRAELAEQGYEATDPERVPVEEALAAMEKRIEAALADEARKAREAEIAARRADAQRILDRQELENVKRDARARASSLDATWKDGAFAEWRKTVADGLAALEKLGAAEDLPRARELLGAIYGAAGWIERNTPARSNLKAQEDALDALAKECAAADAATLAAAALRKAERARKAAETHRDAGRYEDAATGYASAKTLYESARGEARGAKAAAAVEEARTYETAKLWDKCLAAAEQALSWEGANKDAQALKQKAEAELKKIANAKAEAERKKKEEAERKEKAAAERLAKEEAARKAKEEAERKATAAAERLVEESAARKAEEVRKEEAARKEAENIKRRNAAIEEASRKAREQFARRKTPPVEMHVDPWRPGVRGKPGIVSHDIGDPEANLWEEGGWPTTTGELQVLDERPSDPDAPKGHKALRLIVHYGPRSFGSWSAHPKAQTLPGKVVKITGWARKGNDKSWGMGMNFVDANTNSFSWGIPVKSTDWEPFEYTIPEMVNGKDPETGKQVRVPIKFPIKLDSISQNNWGDRNNPEAVDRILDIYDLRVHTDMSQVPVKDRPCGIDGAFPATANCFYYGEEEPVVVLAVGSWLGEERKIRTTIEVESATGERRPLDVPDFTVFDSATVRAPLPFAEPGAYTLRLKATGFPNVCEKELRYAVILHPPALTEQQKDDSPYGINVHGSGYVGYDKFAKLGFVWLRDYAFNYNWLVRARGDGKYAGWPWYPKIVQAAEDLGMRTLPCLMTAISGEKNETPSDEWRRNISHILSSFPQLKAFELDNEVTANRTQDDASITTTSRKYREYHRVFGLLVQAVRPDAQAVQEGGVGIDVNGTQALVGAGDFTGISVCNAHHYCGSPPPERARVNVNVGADGRVGPVLCDLFRQWKESACADGTPRKVWLTEWGFDTRAGQKVSEIEQAAYLQREWTLAIECGVDKLFWYWYYDNDTSNPTNFFDGCGIFDRFRQPKPVAPAFAALRTYLPADFTSLGSVELGPNHLVRLFRREDHTIVALAFKIDKDGDDLVIEDPKSALVCDMFGATVQPTRKRRLDIGPTWYVGLDPGCDWLQRAKRGGETEREKETSRRVWTRRRAELGAP